MSEPLRYPYFLLNEGCTTAPLIQGFSGPPLSLDLSINGVFLQDIAPGDQRAFQEKLNECMKNGYTWGLSSYLENRASLLSTCPQMVEEKRFYHLGLDIIVPAGTPLHAPLGGTVKDAGYEDGTGNYGGYVLLEHKSCEYETFYTLYGHLCSSRLPEIEQVFNAGDAFAETGEFEQNGNWFFHTHLQILTEEGLAAGMQFKGYCSAEDLAGVNSLCPSPFPLFLKGMECRKSS